MNTFSRGNLSLRLTILIKTTISFEIRIITSFILFWDHTTSIRIDKYIIIIIIVNHVYLCAVTAAPPFINAVYAHWQIMHTCETFIVLEGVKLSKLDRFDKEKPISVHVRWSLLLFWASRSVDISGSRRSASITHIVVASSRAFACLFVRWIPFT